MMAEKTPPIRVGICGATGRMGREVVKAVLAESDLLLVMAVDHHAQGEDIAQAIGLSTLCEVIVESDLAMALSKHTPDVVVDFTNPGSVFENACQIIRASARAVIGTTGLSPKQLEDLKALAEKHHTGVLVAPNFAIGAILLMKFAQEASRYFDHAEIIELHHNQKLDAPSGTALRTAELMRQSESHFGKTNVVAPHEEVIPGARGAKTDGNIRIHSVRLPGLVAHEEVLFGGPGQTLSLRHDSLDRTSFMPGVILGIRKMMSQTGLVHGLENLL